MAEPLVFADECKLTLVDGTTVTNGRGVLIDDKRVYFTNEGVELVGDKAVKSIEEQLIVVPLPLIFHIRATKELKT